MALLGGISFSVLGSGSWKEVQALIQAQCWQFYLQAKIYSECLAQIVGENIDEHTESWKDLYKGKDNLVFVKSLEFLSVACTKQSYVFVEITNKVLIQSSSASFSVLNSQVCIYLTFVSLGQNKKYVCWQIAATKLKKQLLMRVGQETIMKERLWEITLSSLMVKNEPALENFQQIVLSPFLKFCSYLFVEDNKSTSQILVRFK